MDIKEHMEVIGADGVHVGTVDKSRAAALSLRRRTAAKAHTGAIIISSTKALSPASRATRFDFPQMRTLP